MNTESSVAEPLPTKARNSFRIGSWRKPTGVVFLAALPVFPGALLPLFTPKLSTHYGLDAVAQGQLFSSVAWGGLLGALWAAWRGRRWPIAQVFKTGLAVSGLACLFVCAVDG